MKNLFCLLALACALSSCSALEGDEVKSNTLGEKACPVINGSYGDGGAPMTIETKQEDGKFSYSIAGAPFLQADAEATSFDANNSMQLTCGSNTFTTHLKQDGQMKETTFSLVGGDRLQMKTGDEDPVFLPRRGDLPQKKQPAPPVPVKKEDPCPEINGTFVSDDAHFSVIISSTKDADLTSYRLSDVGDFLFPADEQYHYYWKNPADSQTSFLAEIRCDFAEKRVFYSSLYEKINIDYTVLDENRLRRKYSIWTQEKGSTEETLELHRAVTPPPTP